MFLKENDSATIWKTSGFKENENLVEFAYNGFGWIAKVQLRALT